jgi:hypothetical protein
MPFHLIGMANTVVPAWHVRLWDKSAKARSKLPDAIADEFRG